MNLISCETCQHCVEVMGWQGKLERQCHREPPRITTNDHYGQWPRVKPESRCGEWAPMERSS